MRLVSSVSTLTTSGTRSEFQSWPLSIVHGFLSSKLNGGVLYIYIYIIYIYVFTDLHILDLMVFDIWHCKKMS